jgi:uncharacterized membrane protein YeaQ/YmgE (transglycosylase-associated protein family)
MNIVVWILVGGIAGWLTGKLFGEKDYGTLPWRSYVKSVDVLLGAAGASLVGYLFFWAVIGGGSSFSTYGTCVLGSVTLVGACRLISASYFPFSSYKGMSRAAFIEWHDTLAMKELASWRPRPRGGSTMPAENR